MGLTQAGHLRHLAAFSVSFCACEKNRLAFATCLAQSDLSVGRLLQSAGA